MPNTEHRSPNNLKQLYRFFSRRDKLRFLWLLVLMLLGAIFDTVGIGAIPAFVAMLAVPEKLAGVPYFDEMINYFGLEPGNQLVLWGSVGLAIIFLLKNLFLTYVFYAQFKTVENYRVTLADRLFTAYMHAPYTFHLQHNSAELIRNVNNETLEILQGVVIPALRVLMALFMTTFIMILLLVVTPAFALLGILLLGLGSALYFQAAKKKLARYGAIAKKERKEGIKAIQQGLGAYVDATVLGRKEWFIRTFHTSVFNFARVNRYRQVIASASPYLLETISVAGLLIIILLLLLSGMGVMDLLPVIALFGAAVIRLRQTLSMIINGMSQIKYSLPAIPAVLDDIRVLKPEAMAGLAQGLKTEEVSFESIALQDVTFTYPGAPGPALENISLQIVRGASVGFVGPTGSGKTTLMQILLGLLQPMEGTILFNGKPLGTSHRSWLDLVGYIPQSIYLTDDSLRANIALGLSPEAIDDEQVWKVLKQAQLAEFVKSLPKGLDSWVGERGIRLSGGQRQRVGLARALYHEPEVLIMDEATSALDNNTENQVMDALLDLRAQRTLIIVAHRLSTVGHCDCVYYLNGGRIEASGTLEELSNGHSGFRRMAEI